MAIGQHFWSRKGWRELKDFVRYLNQTPPPVLAIELRDFHSDLYPNTSEILSRMVKIAPDERFASIDQLLAELGYGAYVPKVPPDLHLRYPLLIVESGSNRGARTLINISDGSTLVMGRTDIAGSNESISRRHLEFSRSGNSYFVRDLGSKNGTLVRGVALSPGAPPTPIQHGDRIKVGDIFLRLAFLP